MAVANGKHGQPGGNGLLQPDAGGFTPKLALRHHMRRAGKDDAGSAIHRRQSLTADDVEHAHGLLHRRDGTRDPVAVLAEAGDDVGFGGTEFKDKKWFHTASFI